MGLFSRKPTIKERLLNLENLVRKNENQLNRLKNSNSYLLVMISPIVVSVVAYILSFPFFISLALFLATPGSLVYVLKYIRESRIKGMTRRVELLKDERKALIEQCRNDENFSTTKSIIDRYDEEESRNAFFSQVKKKKKTAMDSVTGFVLGGDPASMFALICKQCGVHNGMVDPKNDEIDSFQCFNCSFTNERKAKQPAPDSQTKVHEAS